MAKLVIELSEKDLKRIYEFSKLVDWSEISKILNSLLKDIENNGLTDLLKGFKKDE